MSSTFNNTRIQQNVVALGSSFEWMIQKSRRKTFEMTHDSLSEIQGLQMPGSERIQIDSSFPILWIFYGTSSESLSLSG